MARPPIESFDPLLRDLVTYGLVSRDEDDNDWRLTEEAQIRLGELLDHRRAAIPEKLVYLDHLCAHCRTRSLTRLRDGVYVCDNCATAPAAAEQASEVPDSPAKNAG